ncbi:hypothetical protein CEB3_c35860 [Peptococcaceae bacterium CEB3]|nr:hypothetical protein CEB3_c35860 [Peptococcaceae bacterium CEB3]
MNVLSRRNLIQRKNLSEASFLPSLLQESHRLGLLSASQFERIQLQSLQLLSKLTERYTGGESSSVKVETAQGLMSSIFYSIGIYLKSLSDPDLAIEALQEKPLAELYRGGKQMAREQLSRARELLRAIQNDGFVTDHVAYNDTVQEGLPGFFSVYDLDFAAHDTPGSIDYPLSHDPMDLVGVEYIHSYVQKLFRENQFCLLFPPQEIQRLLHSYSEHYQDLLVNIFGLVLTNAIGSLLARKSPFSLKLEPSDSLYLRQKLISHQTKTPLGDLLDEAARELCQQLKISDRFLQEHIATTAAGLSPRIRLALETRQLASVFVPFREAPIQNLVQFEDGVKLSDDAFRGILDEIRECRDLPAKITIIQNELHSLVDLVDLLEGYCIFDDEFAGIFQALGDMELALLAKKLPTYGTDLHITENAKEWQRRLRGFLADMNLSRRERIRELAGNIDLGNGYE